MSKTKTDYGYDWDSAYDLRPTSDSGHYDTMTPWVTMTKTMKAMSGYDPSDTHHTIS